MSSPGFPEQEKIKFLWLLPKYQFPAWSIATFAIVKSSSAFLCCCGCCTESVQCGPSEDDRAGTDLDPGRDSDPSGPNAGVGKDAFGMVLNYYAGDYIRHNNVFNSHPLNPHYLEPGLHQYNGNISSWQLRTLLPSSGYRHPGTVGYTYEYDELYRLSRSDFHVFGSSWSRNMDYDESFGYDKNGNRSVAMPSG